MAACGSDSKTTTIPTDWGDIIMTTTPKKSGGSRVKIVFPVGMPDDAVDRYVAEVGKIAKASIVRS